MGKPAPDARDFVWALAQLRAAEGVRRPVWEPQLYLELRTGKRGASLVYCDGWHPDAWAGATLAGSDILATDWEIFDPAKLPPKPVEVEVLED